MMSYICVALLFITIYTICCNVWLIKRYDKTCQERDEALDDFAKLKMLNKLKVDWDEKPIVWESV